MLRIICRQRPRPQGIITPARGHTANIYETHSGLSLGDNRRRGFTLAKVLRAANDAQESQHCGCCQSELFRSSRLCLEFVIEAS